MNKKLIISIVGETASGKDSITKALPYKQVVSYTTRPKRDNEVNGREHWFITDEEMDRIEKECELVAWTESNSYRYCATSNDLKDDVSIYIINPDGIRWFKNNYVKNVDMVTIGITSSLKIREERAKNRSDFKKEFYKRVAKETQDFNLFKINNEFDYFINTDNVDLNTSIELVKFIINKEINRRSNKEYNNENK